MTISEAAPRSYAPQGGQGFPAGQGGQDRLPASRPCTASSPAGASARSSPPRWNSSTSWNGGWAKGCGRRPSASTTARAAGWSPSPPTSPRRWPASSPPACGRCRCPCGSATAGRVLRHTEQQAGKDREIFQAGVELIGLASPEADAEMIAMAVECLQGPRRPRIHHRHRPGGVLPRGHGRPPPLRGTGPARSRRPSPARTAPEPEAPAGRDAPARPGPRGDPRPAPALRRPGGAGAGRARSSPTTAPGGRWTTCDRSWRSSQVYGVEEHVTFDLGELRGLDYHTGVTFQGFLTGLGRAVCSGGRYDNLTARYGFPAPATGFTFNLLNLLFALDQRARPAAPPSHRRADLPGRRRQGSRPSASPAPCAPGGTPPPGTSSPAASRRPLDLRAAR